MKSFADSRVRMYLEYKITELYETIQLQTPSPMSTFMFNPLGDVNNVRPLLLIYLAILIVFPQAVQNSI